MFENDPLGHDGTGYMETSAMKTFWECPDDCWKSTEAMLDHISAVLTENAPAAYELQPPARLGRYWVSLYEDRPIYLAGRRGPKQKSYRDALVLLGASEEHIREQWFKVETGSRFFINRVDCAYDDSMRMFFDELKPYLSGAVGTQIHYCRDYTNLVTTLEELYFEHEADAVTYCLRRDGHPEACG